MIYVSWAAFYEGASDAAYFDVLIPKTMENLALKGVSAAIIPSAPALRFPRGSVEAIAQKACDAKDAFHVVFFHADTGGRNLEATIDHRAGAYCRAMHEYCQWPPERCVTMSPRHETEAWLLADSAAVMDALGYRGSAQSVGLPTTAQAAQRLTDPKHVLESAVRNVRGPRRKSANVRNLYAAIAQRQSLDALRQTSSFADFEAKLRGALAHLGCL